MAREQAEDPAGGGVAQLEQHARHRRVVARLVVPRLGQIGRNPEQALRGEVERRGEDLPHHDARGLEVEPKPLFEEGELAPGGEGRAGEHDGLHAVEQCALQDRGEVERYRRERQIGVPPAAPLDPTHRHVPASSPCRRGRRPERRREPLGGGLEPAHHAA